MIWQFSWHFEAESSFADEEKKKKTETERQYHVGETAQTLKENTK